MQQPKTERGGDRGGVTGFLSWPIWILVCAAVLVPGALGGVATRALSDVAGWPGRAEQTPLVTFEVTDASDLDRVLANAWDSIDPLQVPGIAPTALPGDLGRLRASERKRIFVRSVLPHVLAANERVRAERRALQAAWSHSRAGDRLSPSETTWVLGIARRYREGKNAARRLREDAATFLRGLLERVDVVPPSLALSQAAIESAWGASRFSREGNALFGQWDFSGRGGMAPRDRPTGATYTVARFETIGHAVEAYLRNLNTHRAYEEFRQQRAAMRARGAILDSLELARGLLAYSARGEDYVGEVRSIIRRNRMVRYDRSRLAALGAEPAGEIGRDLGMVTRSWPDAEPLVPDA